MSGYNVTTPRLFGINDPQTLIQFNLNTLNATFEFPDKQTTVLPNGQGDLYITSDALLGGYIVFTGAVNSNVYIDSAELIINAIKTKMQGLTNHDQVPLGFSFKCKFHNSSNNSLNIYSNATTLIGGSTSQVAQDAAGYFEVCVVDQDRVFVCVSRCATVIAPIYD